MSRNEMNRRDGARPAGALGRGRTEVTAQQAGAQPIDLASEPFGIVGWREWVGLPGLGIDAIKAKVDTGAQSSSLHAFEVQRFRRRGVTMIRFRVHPVQHDVRTVVAAEAELVDLRKVRSSSGVQTLRPVIVTPLRLGGWSWEIEITLVRRDAMGFRMLLGRQALRGRLLVDPARSFVAAASHPHPLPE